MEEAGPVSTEEWFQAMVDLEDEAYQLIGQGYNIPIAKAAPTPSREPILRGTEVFPVPRPAEDVQPALVDQAPAPSGEGSPKPEQDGHLVPGQLIATVLQARSPPDEQRTEPPPVAAVEEGDMDKVWTKEDIEESKQIHMAKEAAARAAKEAAARAAVEEHQATWRQPLAAVASTAEALSESEYSDGEGESESESKTICSSSLRRSRTPQSPDEPAPPPVEPAPPPRRRGMRAYTPTPAPERRIAKPDSGEAPSSSLSSWPSPKERALKMQLQDAFGPVLSPRSQKAFPVSVGQIAEKAARSAIATAEAEEKDAEVGHRKKASASTRELGYKNPKKQDAECPNIEETLLEKKRASREELDKLKAAANKALEDYRQAGGTAMMITEPATRANESQASHRPRKSRSPPRKSRSPQQPRGRRSRR